jgi:hypothetical protein
MLNLVKINRQGFFIRLGSMKLNWLFISVSLTNGPLINRLASGWRFHLYGPQRLPLPMNNFKGITKEWGVRDTLNDYLKENN